MSREREGSHGSAELVWKQNGNVDQNLPPETLQPGMLFGSILAPHRGRPQLQPSFPAIVEASGISVQRLQGASDYQSNGLYQYSIEPQASISSILAKTEMEL
jgi:hypothetical protein